MKSKITLRHLLNHTSGYGDWDTSTDEVNVTKGILGAPLQYPPGTKWFYSSMTVNLLGRALAKIAGQPIDQYIQSHIFDPLGIHSVKWFKDSTGTADLGGGLYMNTHDMLKLGRMMLKMGRRHGHQVR